MTSPDYRAFGWAGKRARLRERLDRLWTLWLNKPRHRAMLFRAIEKMTAEWEATLIPAVEEHSAANLPRQQRIIYSSPAKLVEFMPARPAEHPSARTMRGASKEKSRPKQVTGLSSPGVAIAVVHHRGRIWHGK